MTMATQLARESYTVDYAGFWLRLVAMVIDSVVIGVIIWLFVGLWPLVLGRGWMGAATDAGDAGTIYWASLILIPVLIIAAYFIVFWHWRGQTPGMQVMRITVIRFNGDPVSWGSAVMRFLGYIISTAVLLIGFFWVAYDARRQGWHDKLAETYVIMGRSL